MSKYFPAGLELNDTKTPLEILEEAKLDWQEESDGLVTLIFQITKSGRGDDMILVHAKHVPSNRTASLFSLISRQKNPYPVSIQPKDEELPDFLKKSYTSHSALGRALSVSTAASMQAITVTNKWVSETPSEFRNKLSEAFNLGIIKSEVLNLVTGSIIDSKSTATEEPSGGKEEV